LYKQANELLTRSTSDAVGLNKGFITLPVDNLIISGQGNLVEFDCILAGTKLPKSGVQIDHLIIPVLPTQTNLSSLNEQCLRQYIRSIIASQYNINKLDDMIIYIMMAFNVKIGISDIDESVKTTYRHFVDVMLRKKRSNSDQSEIDRLIVGEAPIPNNGNVEQLYDWMNFIKKMFELPESTKPMVIWYMLCQEMSNDVIKQKQLIHCRSAIDMTFPEFADKQWNDIPRLSLILMNEMSHVKHKQIPIEFVLDYSCLITLTDCSNPGGYIIKPHLSSTGSKCSPHCVLSQEGYDKLIIQQEINCPICYTNLTTDLFESVGPKIQQLDQYYNPDLANPYNPRI
jgi:hypothetical protein